MALILSFFAFQTLPVNYAGILLILLAVVFFILELKVASYGMLSVAGIASLLLGSLMLFHQGEGGIGVAVTVLLPSVMMVSGFFVLVAWLVVRAHAARSRSGAEGMVGEIGVVKKALNPMGKVFVHGELWHATAASPLSAGTRVRVKRVRNLLLEVEPVEKNNPT
jgi:membrane-bound serine protease (ClpP class)